MDTTLQSIIEIALQQGIWAALYIYLFFRMLKENAERETQYQQMINRNRSIIPRPDASLQTCDTIHST